MVLSKAFLLFSFPVNRKEDIEVLAKEAAKLEQMDICTSFHRDISQDSYNYVFTIRDGTMEKYEKESDGDPANHINGQICGVAFRASTENTEGYLHPPKLSNKRVRIHPSHILNENTNLYFSSFYSCDDKGMVQLVLCKNRSKADVTCSKLLIKLNKYKNPFLFISKTDPKIIKGTTGVDVEVFYTHDVKLRHSGIYRSSFMSSG